MWPFARKGPTLALPDQRGLNEDWRAGDLAECIESGWQHPNDPHHPKVGDVLRVSAITDGPCVCVGRPAALITGLRFEGKPQNRAWHCRSFRKLRPVHTAADVAFTALIRRTRRAPVAA